MHSSVAADPLAQYRELFVEAPGVLAYLDGNSLGRPLRESVTRVAGFMTEQWGGRLIRGWDEGWMSQAQSMGDDIGRVCLGAASGQVTIGDSTTVLLYKLVRAAFDAQHDADSARVGLADGTELTAPLPDFGPITAGDRLAVSLRPENLDFVAPQHGLFKGHITEVEFTGATSTYSVASGDQTLHVTIADRVDRPQVGDNVCVGVTSGQPWLVQS